eukprot:COSAG02_NODE_3804_length_6204_cov_3.032760_2_plen_89_part_00
MVLGIWWCCPLQVIALRASTTQEQAIPAVGAARSDTDDTVPKLALKLNTYLLSLVEETKTHSSMLTQAIAELETEARIPLTEDTLDDL